MTETRFVGEALAATLTDHPSVSTITCGSAAQAMALASSASADAILVDATYPESASMVRRLRAMAPLRPIIACAVRETDEDILLWAEAGVTGYLPNTIKLAQVVGLVTAILGGEQACTGRTAAALFRRIAGTDRSGGGPEMPMARRLTRRELQVAELVAAGLSDKQIARELDISLATTKTHVHNLLGKLNLGHRGDVGPALFSSGDRSNVAKRRLPIDAKVSDWQLAAS